MPLRDRCQTTYHIVQTDVMTPPMTAGMFMRCAKSDEARSRIHKVIAAMARPSQSATQSVAREPVATPQALWQPFACNTKSANTNPQL